MSFISVDGLGRPNGNIVKQISEDGITGKMINSPPARLFHEHKQTMLNWEVNGQPLTYISGPFKSVCPGQTRDRYQKALLKLELR